MSRCDVDGSDRGLDGFRTRFTNCHDRTVEHPLVGDVRGLRLFLGVDLVTDRGSRAPATAHARHVVNRMRERGVLLSTEGPHHNVIKIKPPLPFSTGDADHVCTLLDFVLRESALAP